jgi:hypothetical protein
MTAKGNVFVLEEAALENTWVLEETRSEGNQENSND